MKRCHWVKPVLVAQVKFTDWTSDNQLRQSVLVPSPFGVVALHFLKLRKYPLALLGHAGTARTFLSTGNTHVLTGNVECVTRRQFWIGKNRRGLLGDDNLSEKQQ